MAAAGTVAAVVVLLAGSAVAATATVSVVDGAFQPNVTQVRLADLVEWDFAAANTAQHSATENSGLGVWDSGLQSPGATFMFSFAVSGTFPYHCVIHHEMVGQVKVVPLASPTTGTQTTTFVIRWASAIPAGDTYTVQVKGPQDTTFGQFRTGTTATAASFVPNEGIGTYQFRSQLRSGTVASQFSPPRAIRVTS